MNGRDASGAAPGQVEAIRLAVTHLFEDAYDVGFYAGRFLRRHGLAAERLRISCAATMSSGRPARVETITLSLDGLPVLEDRQRTALLAVVEHCTVHNSIRQAPRIRIELAVGRPTAPVTR